MPTFIDIALNPGGRNYAEPVGDVVSELLHRHGLCDQFWYDGDYEWCERSKEQAVALNPLIGKRVKLILEIED